MKKQQVHKTDGMCGVECNPTAPGGKSLGNVMKQHGNQTGPGKGQKHHAKMPMPMKAAPGVKREQPK